MTTLKETQWHDLEAWQMENEALCIAAIPAPGGKLVSIRDKRYDLEWLVQPHKPVFPTIEDPSDYHKNSGFGWDEHFPNLLPGPQPAPGAFHQRELPRAGEVWAKPWTAVQSQEDALTLSIAGEVLPYRFTRTMTLADPAILELHYEATNLGDDPFAYLWAQHPYCWCDEGTEIVLPDQVKEIVNTVARERWGEPGTQYPWPEAVTQTGEAWQLNKVGSATRRDHHKFYVPPALDIRWARLIRRRPEGYCLHMEWSAEHKLYLGFAVDEGVYHPEVRVAFEVTNGYYDDIGIAWKNRRISTLEPNTSETWTIRMEFGVGLQ